jgi:hypothetical protein
MVGWPATYAAARRVSPWSSRATRKRAITVTLKRHQDSERRQQGDRPFADAAQIPPHAKDAVTTLIDERTAIVPMPPQRLPRRTLGTVIGAIAVDVRDRRRVLIDGAIEWM